MKKTVLILEDDTSLSDVLASEFRDHGYFPIVCGKIADIPFQSFDYAVLDMRVGGDFGLNAIDLIKQRSAECRIVILTGYGSVTTAVEAVKRGAVDYLTKPTDFKTIESALLGNRVQNEVELKPMSLSQVEHEYIDFMLTKNDGNISKTARELGLHRQSLQRKLKKYT